MSVAPILKLALRYGALVAGVVAVVGGVIGYLVAGMPGLLGALVGAGLAAVFLGLTAVSMLIAGRVTRGDATNPVFFGIVLGAVGAEARALPGVRALAARADLDGSGCSSRSPRSRRVIGSLIVDVVAFSRARVPYVSDVRLPGEPTPEPGRGAPPAGRRVSIA